MLTLMFTTRQINQVNPVSDTDSLDRAMQTRLLAPSPNFYTKLSWLADAFFSCGFVSMDT